MLDGARKAPAIAHAAGSHALQKGWNDCAAQVEYLCSAECESTEFVLFTGQNKLQSPDLLGLASRRFSFAQCSC
jgi:hypothetical protein